MNKIYLVSILLLALISGCTKKQSETSEQNPGSAKNEIAASSSASGHKAYDVVLEQAPDSIPEFFKIAKAGYDMCATSAKMMKKPVKPFPELPTQFVIERTRIVTDGKSWLRKVDNPISINNEKLNIEMGCEVRFLRVKSSQVMIRHNGRMINVGFTEDGTRTVDDQEDLEAPFNAKLPLGDTSNYSEKRTINGVPLRCLPKTDIVISSKLALDMCVYEKDGELFEANKSPIILYHRAKPPIESASFQYLVVTQPTSFKTLDHVEPSVFDPNTYQ